MKLRVELNGTDKNPFLKWGLTQNPFPQIARMETDAAVLAMQSLGGDPIPDEAYIRAKLRPYFTDEFVELCCAQFKPGVLVKFDVEWKDGAHEPAAKSAAVGGT